MTFCGTDRGPEQPDRGCSRRRGGRKCGGAGEHAARTQVGPVLVLVPVPFAPFACVFVVRLQRSLSVSDSFHVYQTSSMFVFAQESAEQKEKVLRKNHVASLEWSYLEKKKSRLSLLCNCVTTLSAFKSFLNLIVGELESN